MNISKWLKLNTFSLKGKTVAITGSTGGIGTALCRYFAYLGANIILLNRNDKKSYAQIAELQSKFKIKIKFIRVDFEEISSVKSACELLMQEPLDFLILNAGAYKIPRHKTALEFENVFQINFVSPYFMVCELMPLLNKRKGKVIAVSSIAHNYSKADSSDIDFSRRKSCEKIYGNSKRYLTFSLIELFKQNQSSALAIAHPGITLTNITSHFPKLIFTIIKYPMKIIFPSPEKACLSILLGVFENTESYTWIGPRIFNVWGFPKKQALKTCKQDEAEQIFAVAKEIYKKL